MRNSTGSWWSLKRISEIWSIPPPLAITLAAAFCTLCNIFMCIDGSPHSRELQLSRRGMTRAWTMMTAIFISSTLRILLMMCRWKKEERQTLLTLYCQMFIKWHQCCEQDEGDGVMLLSDNTVADVGIGVRNSNERVFTSFISAKS